MKKYALFLFAVLLSFLACKKDNNSNDSPTFPPIVVDDSTAEFNVLFYGNFCVDCPNAHYKLYVDSIYMGKLYGCYTEGDCKCDSNSIEGLRVLVSPGTHSYKAVPYCGNWLENGEEIEEYAGGNIEKNIKVPADNCISVYVSNY